jgi:hypothetical protein
MPGRPHLEKGCAIILGLHANAVFLRWLTHPMQFARAKDGGRAETALNAVAGCVKEEAPMFASGYGGDADELCSPRVLLPVTQRGQWAYR